MKNTKTILKELIAFPTISANPNRELIDYCANMLREMGADITIIEDESGKKANLYATLGPKDMPGILLSGHTDVVPVEGQAWSVPPFEMSEADGKLYGRGTTDMKGFCASVLAMALKADGQELKTPLHIAFSYDEEIGCVGVQSLIEMLKAAPFHPLMCIVGEPTFMQVATGHKGKTACHVTCIGEEAHSALAPTALNAIHMACDLVSFIRQLQDEIASSGIQDEDYDMPYTTLHVGKITGGETLNIVPNLAEMFFEVRNLPEDDADEFITRIKAHGEKLLEPLRADFPNAAIDIEITNTYPALNTAKSAEVVSFVKSLTGSNATIKVAFGTEGGLFSSKLDIPTVVCGPGSMEQGHKPDEFVSLDQLGKCDAMLENLLERLVAGL